MRERQIMAHLLHLSTFLRSKSELMNQTMTIITEVPGAPKAVGPYSPAVRTGNLLFCSGQLPIDPATGKIEAQSIEEQTQQVFANIRALLTSQGMNLSHIVKTTVFLQDMKDFSAMNGVYSAAMGEHKPARSTIQVAALPLAASVEIELVAEYP